eukprot:222944-Amphidinium_carterae.1
MTRSPPKKPCRPPRPRRRGCPNIYRASAVKYCMRLTFQWPLTHNACCFSIYFPKREALVCTRSVIGLGAIWVSFALSLMCVCVVRGMQLRSGVLGLGVPGSQQATLRERVEQIRRSRPAQPAKAKELNSTRHCLYSNPSACVWHMLFV